MGTKYRVYAKYNHRAVVFFLLSTSNIEDAFKAGKKAARKALGMSKKSVVNNWNPFELEVKELD